METRSHKYLKLRKKGKKKKEKKRKEKGTGGLSVGFWTSQKVPRIGVKRLVSQIHIIR